MYSVFIDEFTVYICDYGLDIISAAPYFSKLLKPTLLIVVLTALY